MISFAPLDDSIKEVYPQIAGLTEMDSGVVDAQGGRIAGIPLDVEINIAGLPPTRDRVWFSAKIAFVMLGQTFLESVGAHFTNFSDHPAGRRFALYDRATATIHRITARSG